MKMLLITVLAGFVGIASASTRDSETITFDESGTNASVQLEAEKTHTEYRQETQARTCYRQVVVGYQTRCTQPRPDRPSQCTRIPIWRNMPYTCYVTVSVPYEVFDYHVNASVVMDVSAAPAGMLANGKLTATLNGEILRLRSTGTPNLVVELQTLNQTSIMNGNVNQITASANVILHDAAPVKAALKMSNASVKKSVLSYKLGATDGLKIKHSLKLAKDPIIGSSTILYNDVLGAGVLSRSAQGDETSFTVSFKDLIGRVLSKGRYSVDIKADFDAGVEVINDAELGGLATSKSILYKIN